MQLELLRELRLLNAPQLGRPLHLSAASGLVKVGPRFYVVADDELHLGVFDCVGDDPGTLLRMFAGELPDAPAERKRHKPDLEALTLLPPWSSCPHGALLALGSGSKRTRRRGVLLPLEAHAVNVASVRVLDFAAWFDSIAAEVGDPNIEGAVVRGEHLVLLHRGNKRDATNCLISMDLQSILECLGRADAVHGTPILACERYVLGALDTVPLCFTDGAVLDNGTLVFAAVAEDTADSYLDGPCRGAALGLIGSDGRVRALHCLERPYKIEGIHAERDGSQVKFWCVTDADDATVAAQLLSGVLPCAA